MTHTFTTPNEVLLLTRLICWHLAGRLHGLMSVGGAVVHMFDDMVNGFFGSSEQKFAPYIGVLRLSGIQLQPDQKWYSLQEPADQLAQHVKRFIEEYWSLARWKALPIEEVRQIGERIASAYEEAFQILLDITAKLGIETDFQRKMQQGREMMEALVSLLDEEKGSGQLAADSSAGASS